MLSLAIRCFEAGTGHGAAAICLAQRCANCSVTGIDIQPEIVRLANDNVALNGLSGRVQVFVSDLVRPLSGLNAGAFDHAIANPPFSISTALTFLQCTVEPLLTLRERLL